MVASLQTLIAWRRSVVSIRINLIGAGSICATLRALPPHRLANKRGGPLIGKELSSSKQLHGGGCAAVCGLLAVAILCDIMPTSGLKPLGELGASVGRTFLQGFTDRGDVSQFVRREVIIMRSPHIQPVKKMLFTECTMHWKKIVPAGKRGKPVI
jgi:hypothetical protein